MCFKLSIYLIGWRDSEGQGVGRKTETPASLLQVHAAVSRAEGAEGFHLTLVHDNLMSQKHHCLALKFTCELGEAVCYLQVRLES